MQTVTMLFTDIEGSTRLLDRLGPRYTEVLSTQRVVLRAVFDRWHGRETGTEGDSFFVVFESVTDAIRAVAQGQRDLARTSWTDGVIVAVRMGLHTGEPIRTRTATPEWTCTAPRGSAAARTAARSSPPRRPAGSPNTSTSRAWTSSTSDPTGSRTCQEPSTCISSWQTTFRATSRPSARSDRVRASLSPPPRSSVVKGSWRSCRLCWPAKASAS